MYIQNNLVLGSIYVHIRNMDYYNINNDNINCITIVGSPIYGHPGWSNTHILTKIDPNMGTMLIISQFASFDKT